MVITNKIITAGKTIQNSKDVFVSTLLTHEIGWIFVENAVDLTLNMVSSEMFCLNASEQGER